MINFKLMNKYKIGDIGIVLIKCDDTLTRLTKVVWSLIGFYYKSTIGIVKTKINLFNCHHPLIISCFGDDQFEALFNNTAITRMTFYPAKNEFAGNIRSL